MEFRYIIDMSYQEFFSVDKDGRLRQYRKHCYTTEVSTTSSLATLLRL